MRLTDLADYLRGSGLTVVEQPGWRTRGVPFPGKPDTVLAHHTATSAKAAGDLPTLRLLVEGRSDLPGPLSQLALSRSGVVHVLAGGKANHAGRGAWRGQDSSSRTLGIEAEHPGGAAPWTAVQYDAYVALCAALCTYLGITPARVCGHREWALPAGRKVDPTFDLGRFRQHIEDHLHAPRPSEEDDMAASFTFNDGEKTYWRDGGDTIHIPTMADVNALYAVGVKAIGKLSPEMTARLVEAAKQ